MNEPRRPAFAPLPEGITPAMAARKAGRWLPGREVAARLPQTAAFTESGYTAVTWMKDWTPEIKKGYKPKP